MAAVVYLTSRAPSRFAEGLILAGVSVREALDVSEVLFVCEHEHIDVVMIAPDVEDPDLAEVQMRHATMRLKPDVTPADVVLELSLLFGPTKNATVQ